MIEIDPKYHPRFQSGENNISVLIRGEEKEAKRKKTLTRSLIPPATRIPVASSN
jgi:hypothetical protein